MPTGILWLHRLRCSRPTDAVHQATPDGGEESGRHRQRAWRFSYGSPDPGATCLGRMAAWSSLQATRPRTKPCKQTFTGRLHDARARRQLQRGRRAEPPEAVAARSDHNAAVDLAHGLERGRGDLAAMEASMAPAHRRSHGGASSFVPGTNHGQAWTRSTSAGEVEPNVKE